MADIQEIVDEITEKEPRAYLCGIPVYVSKLVPPGEIFFISKPKADYPWIEREAK